MTIGISKEFLEEKLLQAKKYSDSMAIDLLQYLISSCTELDPWLPIDSAPKDRELLGFIRHGDVGYKTIIHWGDILNCWVDDFGDPITPERYQELPDDPK